MQLCKNCPYALDFVIARVKRNEKPWAGSPDVWLSGFIADLVAMERAGLATRNAAGWWIPT